jgi:hypothetical protein
VLLEEILNNFKKNNPNKVIIVLFKAGSHFFDLNGPKSDTDYRGIYLDSYQDSFESSKKIYQIDYKTKIGEGKNSAEDIDFTLFSLTSFFKLLKSGDFNMMEVLYAPEDKIIYKTPLFDELVSIRKNLLVNDISAFLGFIKKEYKRYGINIYHYKMQKEFINFLKKWPPHDKLVDHWEDILNWGKEKEGIRFTNTKVSNSELKKLIPAIVIAERLHQNTSSIKYVTEAIETVLSRYGHRQKNMASSGIEFKGLYHAMRLIYEANDLYDLGELKFPFSEEKHNLLKRIKNGDIEEKYLFDLIDNEIKKIYKRESLFKNNKKEVENRIDNIEFRLRGRLSIHNIMSRSKVRLCKII